MEADDLIGGRLPRALPHDPMPYARDWFEYAHAESGQRNPNAMTLVTVGGDGQPAGRVVLCKEFVADPGYLVFYTNYESAKSRALENNPRCAAVMHWDALGRQIRIEGEAVRSPAAESDRYFATRGWGSQLGAWGSDQSRPIDSRAELIAQVRRRAARLGLELGDDTTTLAPGGDPPPDIPRPPHWGGFRLWVAAIELWVEGADRIHDRARWERRLARSGGELSAAADWQHARLQP